MNRKFAIGDIHGSLGKLQMLIDKIQPTFNDKLIFLGDYIDRGPQSKEVIDYLIDLSFKSNCVFITGNHEQMLLDFFKSKGHLWDMWITNGGGATIKSYLNKLKFFNFKQDWNNLVKAVEPHMEFYMNLKWYHEDEDYIYVHGGIRTGREMQEQDHYDLIWIREDFIYRDTHMSKCVIFGHTPHNEPLVKKDKIGIDTGACWDRGKLTAIELPQKEFIFSSNIIINDRRTRQNKINNLMVKKAEENE